jgi:hypothetical protein
VAERPYMSLGIDGLQEMFRTATDAELLHGLQYELNHRTSKAASRLLVQVNEKLGVSQEVPEDSSIWKFEYMNIKKRHDCLRATFSIEGEILARWGMTASIPRELEAKVFEYWSKSMTSTEDEFGRTSTQLGGDIERLQLERKGMNPKAIINMNIED